MNKETIDKIKAEARLLCDNLQKTDEVEQFWTIEQFRKTYPEVLKYKLTIERDAIIDVLDEYLFAMVDSKEAYNPVFSIYKVMMKHPRGLSDETKAMLSERLQDRFNVEIKRLKEGEDYSLHSVLEMGKAIAKYLNKSGERQEVETVLGFMADAIEISCENLADMRGTSLLYDLSILSKNLGCMDTYERVNRMMEKGAPHTHESMGKIEIPLTIKQEYIDTLYAGITEGKTVDESITSYVLRYLPEDNKIRDHIEASRRNSMLHHFTQVLYSSSGHLSTIIRPGVEHTEEQNRNMYSSWLQYQGALMHIIVLTAMREGLFTVDNLMGYISQSDIITPRRAQIIQTGLTAYLDEDYVVAISLLIPQIEYMIREMYRACGFSVIDNDQIGTTNDALGTILNSHPLRINDYNIGDYLHIILSDRKGWNLRNLYCHGLTESFSCINADRLVHILLLIAFLTRKSVNLETKDDGNKNTHQMAPSMI